MSCKPSAVSSLTSPCLSVSGFFIDFNLPFVGLAEADDADAIGRGRKAHDVQPLRDIAGSDETALRVRMAAVLDHHSRVKIEIGDARNRQAPRECVLFAFGRVELDPHMNYCTYNNSRVSRINVTTFNKR